jgi:hypothetical protein
MASQITRRLIAGYTRDLAEGKVANKNEQKGENGAAMTTECQQCEDYLIIKDEECYGAVCDDAMSWVVDQVHPSTLHHTRSISLRIPAMLPAR